MRVVGTLVASLSLALLLGGCPAILGIDKDYMAGAKSLDGAAALPDGSREGKAGDADATPIDGGARDSGKLTDGSPKDLMAPPDACPTSCPVAASPGWTLVAFNTDGTPACPHDFARTTVVELKGTGSCSCGSCTVTTAPDCESGMNTTTFNATGSTCDGVGTDYPGNNGTCNANYLGNAGYMSITASAPKGGSCSAATSATEPPTQSEVMCTPATGCANDACEPGLGSAFQTCLYQSGTHNCPFDGMTAHLVGSSPDTSCTTCDCSVSATGCTGTLAIYASSSNCTGTLVLTMDANGTCYEMSGVVEGDSYIYAASATGVSCSAGTSSASVTLNDPGTICCP
jgi:hypothetical protein